MPRFNRVTEYLRLIAVRISIVAVATLLGTFSLSDTASAGVLQRVTAIQGSGDDVQVLQHPLDAVKFGTDLVLPISHYDEQQVFGLTSADVNTDVTAHVSGTLMSSTSGGVTGDYDALAFAGRFGSVGLSMYVNEEIGRSYVAGKVLILSDEFVNLSGSPQRVEAQFIVDGGRLTVANENVRSDYRLVVAGINLGNVPPTTTVADLVVQGISIDRPTTIAIQGGKTFFSAGRLATDPLAAVNPFEVFSDSNANINSDLDSPVGALFNVIDIPLSFQTLPLGVLGPGDRMIIFYQMTMQATVDVPGSGFAGAVFADPLNVNMNANFPTILMTPVPEPSAAALAVLASLSLTFARRRAKDWLM